MSGPQTPLAERIAADLRQWLLADPSSAGQWLRESVLAEQFRVSRTPVRDALRQLHSEGLVEIHPHRGARVVAFEEADLDEIFHVRAMLEGHGVSLAALRGVAAEDVVELSRLCSKMETWAADGSPHARARISELNRTFHVRLQELSGSALVRRILGGLSEFALVRRTFQEYDDAELRRAMRQHREIVAAIEAGDDRLAETVMRGHILSARLYMRRMLARPKESSP